MKSGDQLEPIPERSSNYLVMEYTKCVEPNGLPPLDHAVGIASQIDEFQNREWPHHSLELQNE